MPTRMGKRSNHKRVWLIIGILLPIILIAGGLAYAYSGTDDGGAQATTTSSKASKKSSRKASRSTSKSSNTTSSSIAAPDVVGLGFQISPVLFNGEAVDQAMAENKAPQNLFHDGVMLGYFTNQTQARVSGMARYLYAHTIGYSVNNKTLALNGWQIPLTVTDQQLQTVQWEAPDSNGNTITWKLEPLADAKAEVEARENPDEASSATDVDVHNLTTAQMAHWVKTVIQSQAADYNAGDYTFTQKFVDGYAEVYVYSHQQLTRLYRVDANGYLQAADPDDRGNWQVVSKTYQ
jgi:hypothetical protein